MVSRYFAHPLLLIVLLSVGCTTPSAHRSFNKAARLNPDEASFIRKVPIYPRKQRHAAVASLAMITRYWNSPRATYKLYRAFQTESADASLYGLLDNFMSESQLWFHLTSGTRASLRERIQHGVPMIVFLQDEALNPATLRMAVIVGYDNATQRYVCHDGEEQPVIYSYAELHKKWRAAHRVMLQVCPHDFPTWTLTYEERLNRAKFYENRRDFELAIRDYEAARGTEKANATLLVNLGDLYRLQGKPGSAEQCYREAIANDPHDHRAHNNLAYVLAEQSRSLDEALRLSELAVSQQPENPFALDTLGYALYRNGRHDEASDIFEKARVHALKMPTNIQVRIAVHQVQNYDANGDSQFAREALLDVIELGGEKAIPRELLHLLK